MPVEQVVRDRQPQPEAGADQRVVHAQVVRLPTVGGDDLQAVQRQAVVVACSVAMGVGARHVLQNAGDVRAQRVRRGRSDRRRQDQLRAQAAPPRSASHDHQSPPGARRQLQPARAAPAAERARHVQAQPASREHRTGNADLGPAPASRPRAERDAAAAARDDVQPQHGVTDPGRLRGEVEAEPDVAATREREPGTAAAGRRVQNDVRAARRRGGCGHRAEADDAGSRQRLEGKRDASHGPRVGPARAAGKAPKVAAWPPSED